MAQTAGWVLSYSPEYSTLGADPNALVRLAVVTGGGVTTGDPAEAFSHTLQAHSATRPAWPWLLLLAAVLLPFDVGVRRLVVSRRDLARFGRRLAEAARLRQPAPQTVHARTEQLGALFRAKDRAGGEAEKAAAGTNGDSAPMAAPAAPQAAPAALAPAAVEAAPQEPPPADEAAESKPEQAQRPSGSALAASLLARKKAREEGEQEEEEN